MNDQFTTWWSTISKRFGEGIVIMVLLGLLMCLVAPAFSPLILRAKRCEYAEQDNYEELAQRDMKKIRVILWITAMVAWTIIIGLTLKSPV